MRTSHFNTLGITASLVFIASGALAADPHGYAEDVAEHEGTTGMPQLDPTWFASQIFWLFVTFGVLYVVFAKNILPSLSNILENRQTHIQDDLDQAETLKNKAEKVHAAYEEILSEAHATSSDLFIKAEDDIKKKTETSLSKFRDKSSKKIDDMEASIADAKKEAMDEMHTIAAEIASQAAEKIVGISTDVNEAKTVIQNMSNKKAA